MEFGKLVGDPARLRQALSCPPCRGLDVTPGLPSVHGCPTDGETTLWSGSDLSGERSGIRSVYIPINGPNRCRPPAHSSILAGGHAGTALTSLLCPSHPSSRLPSQSLSRKSLPPCRRGLLFLRQGPVGSGERNNRTEQKVPGPHERGSEIRPCPR